MSAPILTTKLDRESVDAKARFAHNRKLVEKLRCDVAEAAKGGAGHQGWPVERYLRDAKLLDIGAGTNEIRRMLIGRELIGA